MSDARYRIEPVWVAVHHHWHVYDGERRVTPEPIYPMADAVALCERLNREAEWGSDVTQRVASASKEKLSKALADFASSKLGGRFGIGFGDS